MPYRVELSKSGRAGCKNKECKDNGIKINKDELRFGTWVTIQEKGTWAWKHWGCVTPSQIKNVSDAIEGDFEQLDGFDEIPEDLQDKVKRSVEQGHVDNEDWKGVCQQSCRHHRQAPLISISGSRVQCPW
ncbi:zf-PARP-domain-containing protein [Xylona heveae TC161]|uniref:Zf-PARP-domain-containing protein n=1 Tax=Xylona heveae (strain CBS 132557 / TC161) TaxID=1328760 RepID=A0A164ZYJ6_XYLHT|nr:zf-PARP-domain-containing protein [Xylona heveae TC161]KZF19705.1 zf-PARP-domain-containing protein [Xylona heveae TC161]